VGSHEARWSLGQRMGIPESAFLPVVLRDWRGFFALREALWLTE